MTNTQLETAIENSSSDVILKVPEPNGEISTFQLEKLMELTRAGLRKDKDAAELAKRAFFGFKQHEILQRIGFANEKITEAFKVWALNIWEIGWAINEKLIPANHLKAGIHRTDFDSARQFARIDEQELERRITELADKRRLSKEALRKTFTEKRQPQKSPISTERTEPVEPVEPIGDWLGADVQAEATDTQPPKPFTGQEPRPEPVRTAPVIVEEDDALVHLLDCASRNPDHYVTRRYQRDLAYQQITLPKESRRLMVLCLKVVLEDLSK